MKGVFTARHAAGVKPLIMLLAAGLWLSACALGPNYQRPELDVPDKFRWQELQAGDTEFGDLAWWEIYRDPALQQILTTALTANLDVRIAAARVEQARAALGSSRLQLFPNVAIEGSVLRAKTSQYAVLANQDRLGETDNAGLVASYELDIWGRLRRSTETARAQLLATEYARRGVQVTLIADAASAYFTLLSLDQQLIVTRRTLETRQKFVELTRAKHDRGVVSGLDVTSAEAELATAQANLPDIERQIAQTEHQLSILVAQNPQAVERTQFEDGGWPLLPSPPSGLPSTLLERRPDIGQAEQSLVAANARIGAAKAALFPTISLTGTLGSRSPELSQLFSGPAETWSAGVNLLQPLLDADRNLYQIDLAKAAKRESLLLYQRTVQNAFREVADALIARQKYFELQLAAETKVAALRRANRIALARYQSGYSSYFDVINSDRDLFNAELSLSEAYLNSMLSGVQLYRALGGGWQDQVAGN